MSQSTRDDTAYSADRPASFRELHLERLLVVGGASAFAVALTGMIAAAGYLPASAAINYAIAVIGFLGLFYALFRSGLNAHFSDPSLTVAQLLAAGAATTYVLYHGMNARGAVLALYLIAFMFGALTLNARRLAGVASVYVLCYAGVIGLWAIYRADALDLRRELFGLVAFALLLGWFTGLGAYIARLRRELRRTGSELAAALQSAESLARIDPLTGCYNRRYATELLEREAKRAGRGHALTLCVADIDHFKLLNDQFGHQAGDEVLRQFAAAAGNCLRSTDFLVRYGGEEFLIAFTDSSIGDVVRVAERIRGAVEHLTGASVPVGARVTVSMGLAAYVHPEPLSATIARADQALYRAKSGGRNRIVLEGDSPLVGVSSI